MNMLEKIARVIAEEAGEDCPWSDYVDDARAVLTALLEPTPEMIEAGIQEAADCKDSDWDSGPAHDGYCSYEYYRSDAPQRIFQAMIRKELE